MLDDHKALMFKDENMTVYPVVLKSTLDSDGECMSYLCLPTQGQRPFLPKKAKQIKGLNPKDHYKLLTQGHSVTLGDGRVVTPDDVCGEAPPSQCLAFIFMPNERFMSSFLAQLGSSALTKVNSSQIDSSLH